MRRLIFWASFPVLILLLLPARRGGGAVECGGHFPAAERAADVHVRGNRGGRAALLEASVKVSEGKAEIRVKDPAGKEIFSSSCAGAMTLGGQPLKTPEPGMYRLELANETGPAEWKVRVISAADRAFLDQNLVSGIGMIVVGICAVLLWNTSSNVQWRWFGVGAAIWVVGVALKFAWAIPLNGPILRALKGAVPHSAYLAIGSIYIGLLTGVFEVGVTWVAATLWRRMASSAPRAVAVGVGAGAFEAVLLGAGALAAAVTALLNPSSEAAMAMAGAAATANVTRMVWLVGSVERIIAILCHTSSRTLVLFGVARGAGGRWPRDSC